jgi:hypothetical protein
MNHHFLTDEKLQEYDNNINEDERIPQAFKDNEILREICRSGLWLGEQLQQLGCNELLILRIQYTAGQLSFGRDPWEVVQEVLKAYKDNDLEFEIDYNEDRS